MRTPIARSTVRSREPTRRLENGGEHQSGQALCGESDGEGAAGPPTRGRVQLRCARRSGANEGPRDPAWIRMTPCPPAGSRESRGTTPSPAPAFPSFSRPSVRGSRLLSSDSLSPAETHRLRPGFSWTLPFPVTRAEPRVLPNFHPNPP